MWVSLLGTNGGLRESKTGGRGLLLSLEQCGPGVSLVVDLSRIQRLGHSLCKVESGFPGFLDFVRSDFQTSALPTPPPDLFNFSKIEFSKFLTVGIRCSASTSQGGSPGCCDVGVLTVGTQPLLGAV